jgi:MFS family permease
VVALLALQVASGFVVLPRLSFFPVYLEEGLGHTPLVVSAFALVGQVLGTGAALVGGSLSDAIGRRWTLVLGLAALGLGGLAFAIRAPVLVAALWGLGGLGLGLRTPAVQGYLIEAAAHRRLGMLSAVVNLCFIVGAAAGSPAAGAILDARGFAAFGWALLAVSLLAGAGGAAYLPSLSGAAAVRAQPSLRERLGYGGVVRRPGVAMIVVLRFLPTCYYGMAMVLVPLLMNRLADTKMTIALYGTASQILAAGSQLLVGWASDRWGPRWPTLAALVALVSAAVGLGVTGAALTGLFLFGILGNCAAWALSTLVPCLVSRIVPATEHGRVLGLVHLVWNVGMMAGTLLGGALLELSVPLPFLMAAAVNVAAIGVAQAFFRRVSRPAALSQVA